MNIINQFDTLPFLSREPFRMPLQILRSLFHDFPQALKQKDTSFLHNLGHKYHFQTRVKFQREIFFDRASLYHQIRHLIHIIFKVLMYQIACVAPFN